MERYKNLDTYQTILAIKQLAQWSDDKLLVSADEYDFLCEVTGRENELRGFGDDYKEFAPGEFYKIIEEAKKETLRKNARKGGNREGKIHSYC